MRVHGRRSQYDDAVSFLNQRPPNVPPAHKNCLGLFENGSLIGVADVILHWPTADTAFIGLLQLDESAHGRGLARRFHEHLLERFPEPRRWRLNVVDSNSSATSFWERLGYHDTGDRREWTNPEGDRHSVIVMERAVPRTVD